MYFLNLRLKHQTVFEIPKNLFLEKKCSVYLFRAALFKVIFLLPKDALFHFITNSQDRYARAFVSGKCFQPSLT